MHTKLVMNSKGEYSYTSKKKVVYNNLSQATIERLLVIHRNLEYAGIGQGSIDVYSWGVELTYKIIKNKMYDWNDVIYHNNRLGSKFFSDNNMKHFKTKLHDYKKNVGIISNVDYYGNRLYRIVKVLPNGYVDYYDDVSYDTLKEARKALC